MSGFITLEELQGFAAPDVREVEVPTIGKIKVKVLTSADLHRNAELIVKLREKDDPSLTSKGIMLIVGAALCKADGSPMYDSPEAALAGLEALPYEKYSLLMQAAIRDINEVNDAVIYDRAKKLEADQSSANTAG